MTRAQSFAEWRTIEDEDGSRICYFDSYGNLCGLVCVMPKNKNWPGSTENAYYICKLFNDKLAATGGEQEKK